jgi:hypothetical protein
MLVVAAFAPAASYAVEGGTSLNQTPPISSDDAQFQGSDEDCADAGLAPGEVLWHFVLTQTDADTAQLDASFASAGDISVDSYKKTGSTLHFAIITPTADTLLSAWTAAVGGNLNLSHICQGETPSPSPTPSPTPEVTPSPTGSELPAESENPTPSGGVEAATGTPSVTVPPTDTLGQGASGTSESWRLILAGLAALIAMVLVFTQPARSRRSR